MCLVNIGKLIIPMETKPDLILLLHKQFTGHLSIEEKAFLEAWLAENEDNRQYAEELRMVWEFADIDEPEIPENIVEEDYHRLMDRITRLEDEVGSEEKRYHGALSFYKYAAIFLLLMLTAWTAYHFYRDDDPLANAEPAIALQLDDQLQMAVLPDSSRVFLKGNADFSYQGSSLSRQLTLSGQAFFEVARDDQRPFLIYLEEATVKVLGTSFLVKAVSGDPTEISVESGQVEIQHQGQHFHLEQGEQLIIQPGREPRLQLNEDPNYLSWKDNQLVFRQTPMKDVLMAIERHYGISISLDSPNILNCSFTGTFEDAEPDYLLKILSNSLGISTEWTGVRKLRISGGGCH